MTSFSKNVMAVLYESPTIRSFVRLLQQLRTSQQSNATSQGLRISEGNSDVCLRLEVSGQQLTFESDSPADIAEMSGLHELRFAKNMLSAVSPGDIVWDIGANVGLYSVLFSQVCGESGHVYAFEPNPVCRAKLEANLATNRVKNVTVLSHALGGEDGTVQFVADPVEPNTVGHIGRQGETSEHQFQVECRKPDTLVKEKIAPSPCLLKIDVEGFEYEVITSTEKLFQEPNCRKIFCEIHSRILADRSLPYAPRAIRKHLIKQGFTVEWVDSSHIVAAR